MSGWNLCSQNRTSFHQSATAGATKKLRRLTMKKLLIAGAASRIVSLSSFLSRHSSSIRNPKNPSTFIKTSPSALHSVTATAIPSRFFCSGNNNSSDDSSSSSSSPSSEKPVVESNVAATSGTDESPADSVEDVSNKDFHGKLMDYFNKLDEDALPSVFEAILARKLTGKHKIVDERLMDDMKMKPVKNLKPQAIEDDFEELYDTDEEIPDLYNATNHVEKKMAKDPYFNMTHEKYEDMMKEAVELGHASDTRECEQILEDMMNYQKLLPDDTKQKVKAKFKELDEMCDHGEIEPERAYELWKEFENELVQEAAEVIETKKPDEISGGRTDVKKPRKDTLEGPELRWETRVVLDPGGSWHPKNRKVKMSVTVKELRLSKHAYRRLREVVGKRYNAGKDELTIISERFEHREENRKDCLRTLYALIDDAKTANTLVAEARVGHVKERLRANPQFMQRLKEKISKMKTSQLELTS